MKVIKFAPGLIPVLKHQEHDQSTHGSWADSGSPKLTIMGQNDGVNEFFNERTRVVRYQPEGKEPTDYVLYADGLKGDTIFAIKKPTDGTTIDGWSGKPKGVVGHLDVTRMQGNPWRRNSDDGKSTIVEVAVSKPHQRRGLATAMLRFHRDLFPEQDLQHSDALLPDGQAWAEVAKHGEHDQKTHGNWAKGGNGLGIEEVMALQKSSDPLIQKVYDAENLTRKPFKSKSEAPISPEWGVFVGTRDEFDRAVKEYDKKWMAWAVEEQADIFTAAGARLLDGTPSGVKKYVEEIIKSDWFIETFGDGKSLPPLDIKTSQTSVAGSYQIGTTKDRYSGRIVKTTHSITINRQFTKDEATILHEISHYATTISQTESFSGHGVEFARNHVFISEIVAGSARAEALASAYAEKGVKDGD